jgi:hypothetical protein
MNWGGYYSCGYYTDRYRKWRIYTRLAGWLERCCSPTGLLTTTITWPRVRSQRITPKRRCSIIGAGQCRKRAHRPAQKARPPPDILAISARTHQ